MSHLVIDEATPTSSRQPNTTSTHTVDRGGDHCGSTRPWDATRRKVVSIGLTLAFGLLLVYCLVGVVCAVAAPRWMFGNGEGPYVEFARPLALLVLPFALLTIAGIAMVACYLRAVGRVSAAQSDVKAPSVVDLLLPSAVAKFISQTSLLCAQQEAAQLAVALKMYKEEARVKRQEELEDAYMQPHSGTSMIKYMPSWRTSSPTDIIEILGGSASVAATDQLRVSPVHPPRRSSGVSSNYTNRLRETLAARNVLNLAPLFSKAVPQAWVGFCDMVDFTPMCSSCSPSDVLRTLTQLFSLMDALALDCKVQKIKTIGDCYMCYLEPHSALESGGAFVQSDSSRGQRSPSSERASSVGGASIRACWDEGPIAPDAQELPDHHPALRVAGLRMLHFFLESISLCTLIQRPSGLGGRGSSRVGVQLRGGMHFGSVATGVLGFDRPAFDVFGNTVNVAARLEATGLPQRVHLTQASALILSPKVPNHAAVAHTPHRGPEDAEVQALCRKAARFPFAPQSQAVASLIDVVDVDTPSRESTPSQLHSQSPQLQPSPPTAALLNEDTFMESCFFGTVAYDATSRHSNPPPAVPMYQHPTPESDPHSCFSSTSEWGCSEGRFSQQSPSVGADGAAWVMLKGVGLVQTVLVGAYEPPVVWPSPRGDEWLELLASAKRRGNLLRRQQREVRHGDSAMSLPPPPILVADSVKTTVTNPHGGGDPHATTNSANTQHPASGSSGCAVAGSDTPHGCSIDYPTVVGDDAGLANLFIPASGEGVLARG